MYWDEYKYKYEDTYTEEWFWNGCMSSVVMLGFFVIVLIALMLLGGCTTTRYVPVVTTHTDTLIITKQQRDSIFLHDSTHVHEWMKGDTVFVEVAKWKTKYVESIVHDTLYVSKTDSVPVPYPVEVKVPRELNWWQKTRIHCGDLLLVVAVGMFIIGIIKLKMKI